MKKYVIFAVSFILLFTLFFGLSQIIAGMLLTTVYTPDVEEVWSMSASLPQEIAIQSSQSPFILTLIVAFISATIAYFIPRKFFNKTNN